MLIFCSDTPEYLSPSNALKIVGLYEEKMKNVNVAFDVNSNCTGMIQGFDIVHKYMQGSNARNALVVGCFCISPIALWSDTVVYSGFADAAACVAISAQEEDEKRDIRAASPYGYTPLGRLLKEYRTPLPRHERLVIFPEIASWQTTSGEAIPVYEDFNRRGTDYRLAGFWNVQTEQSIKVSEIRNEIIPENRICTLEQAEVYMKAVENFMEDMKKPESAKDNRPIYRTHNEEYVRDR